MAAAEGPGAVVTLGAGESFGSCLKCGGRWPHHLVAGRPGSFARVRRGPAYVPLPNVEDQEEETAS